MGSRVLLLASLAFLLHPAAIVFARIFVLYVEHIASTPATS